MKKQFGIAMIALSAAMALTFTACGDDSSSGTNDPKIVDKVDDLSEECEDGEEALVGADRILYTCTDGKWATEAKSSSSKVTSSSEEEECNPDLENCDEEKDENKEEISSASNESSNSGSSEGGSSSDSGSSEGGSSSDSGSSEDGSSSDSGSEEGGETDTPCTEDTETKTCIDGELIDNENVGECGAEKIKYNKTTYSCVKGPSGLIPVPNDDAVSCKISDGASTKYDKKTMFCHPYPNTNKGIYPLCNGKTYTPQKDGDCADDGNYYYAYTENMKYVEDLRDNQTYRYQTYGTQTWMTQNLRYVDEDVAMESECARGIGAEEADCDEFGRLYSWTTATKLATTKAPTVNESQNVQGICPNGWRVSSLEDYKMLINYMKDIYGTDQAAVEAMQSKDFTAIWPNANNKSGFNMQLLYDYKSSYQQNFFYMLTSSAYISNSKLIYQSFYFGVDHTSTMGDYPDKRRAVRCVKIAD